MEKIINVRFPVKVKDKYLYCFRIETTGDILHGYDVERQYTFSGNVDRIALVISPYDDYVLIITTKFNVRYTVWKSIEEAKHALNNENIVTNVLIINGQNEYIISKEDDDIEYYETSLVRLKQFEETNNLIEANFNTAIKGRKTHLFVFKLTDDIFYSENIDANYEFNKDFDKIALVKTGLYPKVLLITQQFKLMLTNWDTIDQANKYIGYHDLVAYYVHVHGKPYALVADADEDIDDVRLPIPSISLIELNEDECPVHKFIIETGTQYFRKIQNLNYTSFADIQNLSVKYIRKLDVDELDSLFEQLDHGEHILTSVEQLYAYMYCYGKMHEAKMTQALNQIPSSFFMTNDEIEVIDYACGQAIATLCLIDYLSGEEYDTCIKKTILIEPSEKALARASLHCKKVNPDSDILTINKAFDDLVATDIPKTRLTRIHLLSNILDIDNYDITHLSNVLEKSSKKGDLFICVDPWYHDRERDGRQRHLKYLLNGKEIYNEVFNKYQLAQDKSWTAIITLFKKL